MNKPIVTIPTETMTTLSKYHWPGNIRELENLIERSVILSQGPDLRVPLGELEAPTVTVPNEVTTLEAAEREHILRVLRETRSEEHTSELQSLAYLVCRLLLEKK